LADRYIKNFDNYLNLANIIPIGGFNPILQEYKGRVMDDPRLVKAIQLTQSEQKVEARQLLESILSEDNRNALAWLWMSYVVADYNEKRICLENVLTIKPEYKLAKQGLEILEKRSALKSELIKPLQSIDAQEEPSEKVPPSTESAFPAQIRVDSTRIERESPRVKDAPGRKIKFNPRYLTFIGGLIAGFGVLMVWEEVKRYTEASIYTVSSSRGFESVLGLLVLAGAIALCIISLVHKIKPMRPSSPYSIIIALFLMIITVQKIFNEPVYLTEHLAFTMQGVPYTAQLVGDGVTWSALGLGLSLIGAIGINPGSGSPDWLTFVSIGLQWFLTVAFIIWILEVLIGQPLYLLVFSGF